MRVTGTESRLKAFSSAYEYARQYPHQSANGRRELRAMDKENATPSARTSQHTTPGSRDQSRNRSKINSVDTAIHVPTTPSRDAMNEFESEDFQRKYNTRPDTERPSEFPDFSGMDDGTGQPVAVAAVGTHEDHAKRAIHIPARSSSHGGKQRLALQQPHEPMPQSRSKSPVARDSHQQDGPPSPETADESNYEPGARSSAGSVFSQETTATSIHTLPPLQSKAPDNSDVQYLEPVLEDDPRSWDLVGPASDEPATGTYALEQRSELLFSAEHLRTIFEDPKLLLKFTGFLNSHRPKSIPILIYYLDALKALRAINYANAIAEALEPIKGQRFTDEVAKPTSNTSLEEKANRAFDVLVQEDLPAYVAHIWIQVVSVSIQRRITGTLAPHLREASEGLAEVFCLTDPSRTDNPIVFASEEFTRTTQYGMNYIIGRNCRFLQGPRTSPHSVRRLAIACSQGKEHTEVFVNYRRDGSPFMNLLMTAPLMDSRGNTRYFIGAQVDVSGLIKDCSEMEGLIRLLEKQRDVHEQTEGEAEAAHKDEFQELSEMFNGAELDTVRRYGGRMHKEYVDDSDRDSLHAGRPRLLLRDPGQDIVDKPRSVMSDVVSTVKEKINGKLEGIYQHYLLIRPAPSLRILFTSPSLRVPGILQSPFLNRIGGSSRVRADLGAALAEGRGVTAKIRWLTRPDEDGEGEGRPRWIHCTPLLGHSGAVGVWMIILVDEEGSLPGTSSGRRFRQAPPVANNIGGKEWDASLSGGRKNPDLYDAQSEKGGSKHPDYYHRPVSRSAHSAAGSPKPRRSPGPYRGTSHVTSANASEFSFNLKN